MPRISAIEKKVSSLEGFNIKIRDLQGGEVKANKQVGGDYDFKKPSKDDWTVGHWKTTRFVKNVPGFDCEVVNGAGKAVNKAMKLKNLRGSYAA